MLTINNFKSSLLNSWWGGWKITDVLEDVHTIDDDLNLIGNKQYSVTFRYYRADGYGGGRNMGRFLLERETDEFLEGKYRYRIYLNAKMINMGGVSVRELNNKTTIIETVVAIIDCELRRNK